jgi:hypothetical protein
MTLALARSTRMGGVFMSNVVSTLMERLDPRALAMCGVCAGNPADLALGDVAIASTVFQYDEGKRTVAGFQGDLFPTPMDIQWIQRAKNLRPEGMRSHGKPSRSETALWLLERSHGTVGTQARSPVQRRCVYGVGAGAECVGRMHGFRVVSFGIWSGPEILEFETRGGSRSLAKALRDAPFHALRSGVLRTSAPRSHSTARMVEAGHYAVG